MIITWADAEQRFPGSSVQWDAMHYPARDPDPPYAWRLPAPAAYTVETIGAGTPRPDLYVFESGTTGRMWWWNQHAALWEEIGHPRIGSRRSP